MGKRKECSKSWYTIQADFRHFIVYDCHDICSLAEAGKYYKEILSSIS